MPLTHTTLGRRGREPDKLCPELQGQRQPGPRWRDYWLPCQERHLQAGLLNFWNLILENLACGQGVGNDLAIPKRRI